MTALEKHGAAVLREKVEPAKPETAARCYYVRIVYRSMGDELVAVEVGPLACIAAEALLAKHRRTEILLGYDRTSGRYLTAHRSKSAAEGAYMVKRHTRNRWTGDTAPDSLTGDTYLANVRVVTLPSQYADPVVRVDDVAALGLRERRPVEVRP